jgi:hypothetical protein
MQPIIASSPIPMSIDDNIKDEYRATSQDIMKFLFRIIDA